MHRELTEQDEEEAPDAAAPDRSQFIRGGRLGVDGHEQAEPVPRGGLSGPRIGVSERLRPRGEVDALGQRELLERNR